MSELKEKKKRKIEKNILKKRKYKALIYNRALITMLLVFLQIVFYALVLVDIYNSTPIFITVNVFAILFVLYILNKADKPSVKLNWVIMILAMPVFGIPLYLMFGEGRPTRKMNKKITNAKKENSIYLLQDLDAKKKVSAMGREGEISRYLLNYADYPVYSDGDIKYYPEGKYMFKDMLEAMESAENYILAEYFIIAGGKMWDAFKSVLLKKAEEGVKIRIMFDDVGSLLLLPPKFDKYLESLHPNIKCFSFNRAVPIFTMRMNNRDHRKILVVDGKVAFTGGINIADEYIDQLERFGKWKDTGVRVTGGAVTSFVRMFFNIWNAFKKEKENLTEYLSQEFLEKLRLSVVDEFDNKVPVAAGMKDDELINNGDKYLLIQPYDDSPLDRENVGETVYLDMINRAQKYLYIFTPYLILDDYMRAAICNASKRGVDVRIVTPGIPDKKMVFRLTRANYGPLIKTGVKIYEYTPGFIHAKSMICDDETAVVGTINLDYRSLYLHFENAVFFSNCKAVMDLKKDCLETFNVSKKISMEDTRTTVVGRFVDSVLRVFESMF